MPSAAPGLRMAPGHRADLRPGSADLAPVAAELGWIARTWARAGVPPLHGSRVVRCLVRTRRLGCGVFIAGP
ncbi:hypothetical protein [Embleya sp. AB8]|uniref:hypothetical protein n=1 Tax=Embleya sp. AB8 TaxID=3156304 RepID=UPI003C715A72